MTLNIKIENFEGPFDLLLHVIKKNKMDIYDIKIQEITTQYLEYINKMKVMDLEVTSEFIVIAATLLEIKSKMLLPKEKKEDNEESEEDPRKELINKLIEYKKFKYIAQILKKRETQCGRVFAKKPEIIEEENAPNDLNSILKGITMLKLYNIYDELINRYNNKQNTNNTLQKEIPIDTYKIENKMVELEDILKDNKTITFSNIAKKCTCKIEIVVTFLALLELMKLRSVKVLQENNFKEIYIERIHENG